MRERYECKDDDIIQGGSLVFILHWNIYSVKQGEPERTVGSHIESLARWRAISRGFQEVEGSSGTVFQRYLAFCGIPRATPIQVCESQTPTSV